MIRNDSLLRRVFLLLGMGVFLVSAAQAQVVSTTALVGSVTDSSGAAIANSQIVATNQQTHEEYTAATNGEGYYNIQFVKAGIYTIAASQTGMQTLVKTDVLVETDQIVRTNFALSVGQTTSKITVVSQAPPMATDDAALRETVNTQQTEELPLYGRDVLSLATLTPTVLPGMKDPVTGTGGEDFNAAGAREIQNNVSLDGVSIMNNIVNEVTFHPSVDTIAGVDIQTGTYQAQYGNYLGLQMNVVTKSGTNQLHGSVYEFITNDALDAANFFQGSTPKAYLNQNQFGFELGGPIVLPHLYNGRDKTFFMANYEGLRELSYTPTFGTVLTPLMRMGNFSEYSKPITSPPGYPAFTGNIIPSGSLSPQALKLLAYEPLPNLPGISNNLLVNVLNPQVNGNQSIDRIDQSFGQKVRLFFREAWFEAPYTTSSVVPTATSTEAVVDHNFVIGYVHVISPNMVNEFHLGHQYADLPNSPLYAKSLANATQALGIPGWATNGQTISGLPSISITGYTAPGASSPSFEGERAEQLSELLSWTHGAHSMSMGFDVDRISTEVKANNTPLGAFTFSGTITGFAPADFMLGLPLTDTTLGTPVLGNVMQYRNGFFFVDKWQASRKLTLSLGLRYELPTVAHSVDGYAREANLTLTGLIPATVPQVIPFTQPNHKDFAPRFGFAYRANDKWVVRGGFGIYFNAIQLNAFTLMDSNPPMNYLITYNSLPTNPTLSFNSPVPAGVSGTTPAANINTVNPNLPTAYMEQWSMDVERSLWRNAALDVQYLGSHTLHLDRNFYPNTPQPCGFRGKAGAIPELIRSAFRN